MKTFTKGLEFFQVVGDLAEEQGNSLSGVSLVYFINGQLIRRT